MSENLFRFCSKDQRVLCNLRECTFCHEKNLPWFCNVCERWYADSYTKQKHIIRDIHKKKEEQQKNEYKGKFKLFFVFKKDVFKIDVKFDKNIDILRAHIIHTLKKVKDLENYDVLIKSLTSPPIYLDEDSIISKHLAFGDFINIELVERKNFLANFIETFTNFKI